MPRFCLLLFLISGFISGTFATAQSAPLKPASQQGAPAATLTLGHSLVPLNGPWKFHVGDNPEWASPAFNDSAWETVDLTPKVGSVDPNQGIHGFVPGWTAKGHPGYSGYAWYRIRVRVTGADGPLALRAPVNVDDSYEVFANGRLIGSFGNFSGPVPTIYSTRPLMFALPASVLQQGDDGTMELAFRFYMAPRTLLQIGPGGMHDPPYVGLADSVTAAYHVSWETYIKSFSSALGSAFLFLGFSLLIFMLYVFDRTETIILWPLAACVSIGIFLCLLAFSVYSVALTALQASLLQNLLGPVFMGLWLITWLAYYSLSAKKWLWKAIIALVCWVMLDNLLFQTLTLRGRNIPHSVFTAFRTMDVIGDAVTIALLVLIAFYGIRKARRVDRMLLLALIFFGIPSLNPLFRLLHIRTTFFPYGINVQLQLITLLAMLFCFSFVLIRRFRASQRRQQAMIHDVKQAQEVQQVLIPEKLPKVPGLAIESEYRPANEVGGDFFQIIPHASDGSALIVAGDVTGKGLQAGMLVALIVGSIRTAIEKSFEPLDVLHALNRRLFERGNAHATCLAMRIAADGAVTLANAGHLPPYLNGKELPMPGAVPLGMAITAEFASMQFQLAPDDRLMLLSDGVAEAQDEHGRLFGFERIQELLNKPISAAEIASAAQTFGQHDDISILSITRTAVLEEALA